MKNTAAIGNTLFIYLVALLPVLLFANGKSRIITFLWEHLFFNNIFIPLGFILLLGVSLYLVNMLFVLSARHGKWTSQELCRTNMIVKLVQIPAYLFIFVVGLLCAMMIFTIGISFAFVLLDIFSIGMTGLFACSAFCALKKEQKISGKMQLVCSLASFLFCADIIIALIGYRLSTDTES